MQFGSVPVVGALSFVRPTGTLLGGLSPHFVRSHGERLVQRFLPEGLRVVPERATLCVSYFAQISDGQKHWDFLHE
jgi:hypothetical protein